MEKLFGTPELLVIIYKNLTFADQLRFARVNSFLRSIFESFIFHVKFTKFKITTLEETKKLLVSNDKNENCMLLTLDEVKNFLLFGADKFEEMHVNSDSFLDSYTSKLLTKLFRFICVEACVNLQNLTCLHYVGITLSEKHLLLVAENCPKLSELEVSCCQNKTNGEYLMLEKGLSISTLARMKQLKSFELSVPPVSIGTSLFCKLITNVPLERLRLLLVSLEQDIQDNPISETFQHHLKDLYIKFDSESLTFFERTGILKNLVKLQLYMDDATDSDLRTIANACQNLECLSFDSTHFTNTTHFVIPSNLKELFVGQDLKPTQVIDILTVFKIEKLRCRFDGDPSLLQDIKISPYIKVLDLWHVDTSPWLSSHSNRNTLKELHWYDYDSNLAGATQNSECLKACKNLENLILHGGHIPIDVVLELKNLQKLKIVVPNYQFSWSYIDGLFKHSSLMELDIECKPYDWLNEDTNIPTKGFPSTIRLLHLEFEVFELALGFWLDMLQQNLTMLIKCEIKVKSKLFLSFLTKLIQHENFPTDLKEIKVWGFNLKCKDLRKNLLATLAPLKQITFYKRSNSILILSRKQT